MELISLTIREKKIVYSAIAVCILVAILTFVVTKQLHGDCWQIQGEGRVKINTCTGDTYRRYGSEWERMQ